MKKGQIYQGVCGEIRFPNRTIVTTEEGEVCLVPNALPGQRIEFQVARARKDRSEGRLLSVLNSSPDEINENVCPHAGICGGCLFQTMSYEKELEIKEKEVRFLLDGVTDSYIWEGIKRSPGICGYRNKMEFSFGNESKDGPLTLGLHRRNGFYDIIPVEKCNIVDGDFQKILSLTQSYFREKNIPFYHKLKHEGILRHLVVRKGLKTGELMISLVTTSELQLDLTEYTEALLSLETEGEIVSLLHMVNDNWADMVQADEIRILHGRDYIYDELLGLRFKITPFSFFQTNTFGAEVLYETVRNYLGALKDKTVFDLYSGTGTITQVLSAAAKRVIGVEIVEEAVEAAKVNTELNHIENCSYLCGDVMKVLDSINEKPDIIVLDPPREGLHEKALLKIINYRVDRLVYIACKPTSLARDIPRFLEAGYVVERACSVDMFSRTQNVETVAVFQKNRPTSFGNSD